MKLIFLDIDGVLNSWRFYKNNALKGKKPSMLPDDQIDPKAVGHLNEIIEATGALVVVSSTWRLNRTPKQLQEILNKFGFIGCIIGKTPSMHRDAEGKRLYRGDEIQYWLNDNKHIVVDSFVIIDDDSDMAHLIARLFKTDMKGGLKKSHIGPIIGMLDTTQNT